MCGHSFIGLVESLILTKVGDGQTERVDGNEVIRDLTSEKEHEVSSIERALQFAVVSGPPS